MNIMAKEKLFKISVLTIVYISFIAMFWPFKNSILFASLFALALAPVTKKTEKFIKNEKWNILFLVSVVVFIFIGPLTTFVLKGILNLSQLNQDQLLQNPLLQNIEVALKSSVSFIQEQAMHFGVTLPDEFQFESLIPKALQSVLPLVTSIATQLPGFFLQLLVFLSSLYFLLLNRKSIHQWFLRLQLISETSVDGMIFFLQRTCYIIVISTLVIASIQALIISTAASIAGYNDFLTLFLITFFMSFIPVIGSAPISISLAIYSFIQNKIGYGILLIVAASIASVIDNVIKTYVLSKEGDKVHPLISLLSLVGALAIFGFIGLFLGPIISQLAFSIHRILNPIVMTSNLIEKKDE